MGIFFSLSLLLSLLLHSNVHQ